MSLTANLRKTIAFHANVALRWSRGRHWVLTHAPALRPIIVVGCSRAGTTVVYKTLSQSRELGSLNRETHDFWADLHPLAERAWATHALHPADASDAVRDYVTRYFYAWTGRRRWVDKNNQNGLCIAYLLKLFPDATFVYVKRSPGDNLNSLLEGWGKPDEFATWSEQLPAKVAIEGRYRQWCFFLADGWRDYLERTIEEVCAFQYFSMNRAILDARALVPPAAWVELFYEDLVRDPVASFRHVFESCGLNFDSRLERHCSTVLGRPYNAFSPIRLDKWRDGQFRDKIERVLPSLDKVARDMGYQESM